MNDVLSEFEKTRWVQGSNKICHAPFISLNFDQEGNIRACCYNVIHPLGKFPTHTIAGALGSANTQALRKAIDESDFSKGCYNCEQQLLSKNYYSVHARHYDLPILKLPVESVPRVLEFEISNICNLECIMCSGFFSSLIRKNRENLPPLKSPYNADFVDQIRPYWKNAYVARFLGGEPFLNSIYFKMWDHIKTDNPNLNVSITTNGTILNDRVRDLISKIKPNISISLDSIHKQTYESIRINADFDMVMKNVEEMSDLLSKVDRKVHLSVCPMTLNWQEMPELFVWGTNRGISVNLNTVLNPENLSLRHLPKSKLLEIIHYYQSQLDSVRRAEILFVKNDNYTARANFERFNSLLNQVIAWHEQALN